MVIDHGGHDHDADPATERAGCGEIVHAPEHHLHRPQQGATVPLQRGSATLSERRQPAADSLRHRDLRLCARWFRHAAAVHRRPHRSVQTVGLLKPHELGVYPLHVPDAKVPRQRIRNLHLIDAQQIPPDAACPLPAHTIRTRRFDKPLPLPHASILPQYGPPRRSNDNVSEPASTPRPTVPRCGQIHDVAPTTPAPEHPANRTPSTG